MCFRRADKAPLRLLNSDLNISGGQKIILALYITIKIQLNSKKNFRNQLVLGR